MQDPTFTTAGFPELKAQFPEHEQLRCPRCDSTNTKFCYYNNYNLSQPRHFCKSCKRYWTKGGSLRNIPVGGSSRKNTKRSAAGAAPSKQQQQQQQQQQLPRVVQNPSASTTPPSASSSDQNSSLKPVPTAQIIGSTGAETGSVTPVGGGVSFNSLLGLASEGQFGNLLEGLGQHGPNEGPGQDSGSDGLQGSAISSEGYMINGLQNGWPDLAIYTTPGSKYQ